MLFVNGDATREALGSAGSVSGHRRLQTSLAPAAAGRRHSASQTYEWESGNVHLERVHPFLFGPAQPNSYFDVPPGLTFKKSRIFLSLRGELHFLFGDRFSISVTRFEIPVT